MADAIRALRNLEKLAATLPPELERVVREELLGEMLFAYWAKWEREL